MKILYFGREQENGYMRTVNPLYGGIVADVDDKYYEYIDWSSFVFAKKLTDEEYEFGVSKSLKHYNEYWTCDQTDEVTDTWRPTKESNLGKDKDENGNTWTKTKVSWTAEEEAKIVNFDKAWITGKLAVYAISAYSTLDVDRGPVDKETWQIQYSQAKEYKQTNSAGTLLKELANAKGVTVANLADSIIRNSEEYQKKVAKVLGISTKLRKELKNATTVRQVQAFCQKYLELPFGIDNIEETPARELFNNI